MATQQDYTIGTAALAKVVADAINAHITNPMERSMIPQAMVATIEAQGAKAVIDAVDAERAKGATS